MGNISKYFQIKKQSTTNFDYRSQFLHFVFRFQQNL